MRLKTPRRNTVPPQSAIHPSRNSVGLIGILEASQQEGMPGWKCKAGGPPPDLFARTENRYPCSRCAELTPLIRPELG
jgi:hypothetical protein